MFDAAQYLRTKERIEAKRRDGDVVTISKDSFDPETGEPIKHETEIDLAELRARVTAFQDYIDNVSTFLQDIS